MNAGTIFLIVCFVPWLKFITTMVQRARINDAIYVFYADCIDIGDWASYESISPDDMELEFITFIRWWDWGCKRILPKDKYEIIKPYIE